MDLISKGICEPSKSSTYEVASPPCSILFGEPGFKYAKSPLIDKFETASVSIFGSLLTNFVKNGTSVP